MKKFNLGKTVIMTLMFIAVVLVTAVVADLALMSIVTLSFFDWVRIMAVFQVAIGAALTMRMVENEIDSAIEEYEKQHKK